MNMKWGEYSKFITDQIQLALQHRKNTYSMWSEYIIYIYIFMDSI